MISGRHLIVSILICCVAFQIKGQLPGGSWRDHLPYSHGFKLAEYDNRVFCLTSDGSLYSYNLRDRSIKKHSKVNGLSDADISTIGSSADRKTFLIGYRNGNIDLIRKDSVFNISDIKRKTITGGKSIRNVYFHGQYAYLACDFGIVLFDPVKGEIKDTYFFGPGGTQISVNDIAADESFLYAATEQGIFRASLTDPNLLDFNAWTPIQTLPDPAASYGFVVAFNNRIFTLYRNPSTSTDMVLSFDMVNWEPWQNSFSGNYEFIGNQKGFLVLSSADLTKVFSQEGAMDRELVSYYAKSVLIDSENRLWYAASYGGLVMTDNEGNGSAIAPQGPPFRDAGDIEILDGRVWVGGGTFNSQWSGYGAYSLIDEQWHEYNGSSFPELKDFLNISEIAIDPLDPSHVIGGSYGYGIVEFRNGVLISLEDQAGGVLRPVQGYEGQPGYVRITGVDFDAEGTAYAVGSNALTAVYKKAPDEEWTAIDLEYEDFGFNNNLGEILVTSQKQKWIAITTGGILAFKDENGVVTNEKFISVKNQEGDVFDNILSLAEDKDGSIWVGTNKGPVIYQDPEDIFNQDKPIGYQPLIPRNDGTNFASLLLSSEQINDIEVDGADRKWIATQKSGVFLLSPDGKKEIHHFTEENSPLFSNSVQTIAVNDKTGEVFFGSEKGIVAFRSVATEGGDDFGDVYVFPNPVREDYDGDITVTGLAANVNVKITDIAGNLVYETTALGGQAVWNGRNFRGDRVQTGVYMVFCTNEDGLKTFVTKLLLIH